MLFTFGFALIPFSSDVKSHGEPLVIAIGFALIPFSSDVKFYLRLIVEGIALP